MPSRAHHRAKAAHNIAFYKTIDAAAHGDWAVTALFYAALHIVDACMDPTFHPQSHSERNSHFLRIPVLRPLYGHYRQLQDDSRAVRYNPPTGFDAAAVQALAQNQYEPIRQGVAPVLGAMDDCIT